VTHTRLIQGNANLLKEMLAAKLDITAPGPGYIHFPLNPDAGFDEEFFRQLLSERREKKMRNGTMSIRWVQTRERNEALDLVCMVLCAVLTYRDQIDAMEAQTVSAASAPGSTDTAPATAPSRTKPASAYGVLPGSDRLAARELSEWGVQPQVARERDPGSERRTWGVQPSMSNIWSP
jgi:phage terminase large subunit GpA-like protein